MNRLLMMVIACVSLTLITSQLQAAEEKNPFASYFSKIERNEKKMKKMDKKKDKKKITAYKDKITKDRAKLKKVIEAKTEEIDQKIAKLEARLEKEQADGKDTNPTRKQLHEKNNELLKIEAWAKNQKPPKLEKFVAETKKAAGTTDAGTGDAGGDAKGGDDEFDAEAFRKSMETDDSKKEEKKAPPKKKKKKKPAKPKDPMDPPAAN